jgi:hypothetical protein
MTPEETRNENLRVQKAKAIEEVDMRVEKDMIELTILEASDNIKNTKGKPRRERIRK